MSNVSTSSDGFSTDTTHALLPVVYDELKLLARRQLRGAGGMATLCTTELVHEAYLRLARRDDVSWESRGHFFGAAARAMRQVLVDFARRRRASKRVGGQAVSLSDSGLALEVELDNILALDAALDHLDTVDARLRRVVELRFFGGVAEDEIAAMLGISVRTVARDWLKARLFLLDAMEPAGSETPRAQDAIRQVPSSAP